MTYCLDFRKRVLSYKIRHGLSFEATVAHFCISKSSLVRCHIVFPPRQGVSIRDITHALKCLGVSYKKHYITPKQTHKNYNRRGLANPKLINSFYMSLAIYENVYKSQISGAAKVKLSQHKRVRGRPALI